MRKLLPLAAVVFLAGCPTDLINGVTKLEPKVLAITKTSAAGNTTSSVGLKWNDVLNAKIYQIIKTYDTTTTTLNTAKESDREYSDSDVRAGVQYSYTIRALDTGNNQVAISSAIPVEMLPPTVGMPGATDSIIPVSPGKATITWTAAAGAQWYYVSVVDAADNKVLYGGFANTNTWQIGAPSYQANLNLPGFTELTGNGFTNGRSYLWKVSAIRANSEKLEEATALDIRESQQGKIACFSN